MLVVNKLVPAAAVMSGLKVVPMKRFLGLLCVDSQNADYMKKGSLDLLVKLTNDLWTEEIEKTRVEMLEKSNFDAGMSSFSSLFLSFFFLLSFSFFLCSFLVVV